MAESEGQSSLRTAGQSAENARMRSTQRKIVVVAFDDMELLDIVGPIEIFYAATRVLQGAGGYRVAVATPDGQAVRGASGLRMAADVALQNVALRGVDTVLVGGAVAITGPMADRRVVEPLRRISAGARRTCSVCTGAFVLGAAGLLDGRRATTHWAYAGELARRFPAVRLEPDRIFVRDGPVTTSAGVTAGMDLALALVEEDHGPHVARTVARWMVMFLQRPGGQSQFSERLALPPTATLALRSVLDGVVADPAGDHRVPELARRASVSERHLSRLFAEQAQTSPARFVERVRVEAARSLLETSDMSIHAIVVRCGFGSSETMRRAFRRMLGVGPCDYRDRFRSAEAAGPATADALDRGVAARNMGQPIPKGHLEDVLRQVHAPAPAGD
jgi:transcriptional regulator GlxA family with amidase domain